MKGIILAAGDGTRLYPLTLSINKQLLPVYDQPLIYHPLCTLMLAGLSDILVIVTPAAKSMFQSLLGDGSRLGLSIQYAEQLIPDGIAQAFLIGEDFIGEDAVCLILGDNILYGSDLSNMLTNVIKQQHSATAFAYLVSDPKRYGVIEFDESEQPFCIVEKPTNPRSNFAITGLYFVDNQVVEIAKQLTPSARGELEITDILQHYLAQGQLHVEKFNRGYTWIDAGTHDSLLAAANFIQLVERRQGVKIGCPEEVAWRKGFIDDEQLLLLATPLRKSGYGQYLIDLLR